MDSNQWPHTPGHYYKSHYNLDYNAMPIYPTLTVDFES